jgi:hypothetical protein
MGDKSNHNMLDIVLNPIIPSIPYASLPQLPSPWTESQLEGRTNTRTLHVPEMPLRPLRAGYG